jgi:hypothetical protein
MLILIIASVIVCGVMGYCTLTLLRLSKQIKQIMTERHAELWNRMLKKAWDKSRLPINFAWHGMYKTLNDKELTERVLELRVVQTILMLFFPIWFVIVLLMPRH